MSHSQRRGCQAECTAYCPASLPAEIRGRATPSRIQNDSDVVGGESGDLVTL